MAIKLETKRALLLGFIGSVAACGLVGIYCLLKGTMGPIEQRVLSSTALVGAAAILGLASAIPWERRRWHPIGPMAMIVMTCALLLALLWVWGEWLSEEIRRMYYRWLGDLTLVAWVFAVALPLVGMLGLARLHRRYGWVRRWTVVAVACLALLVTYMILADPGWEAMDVLGRIVGVFAILSTCGTLAVAVLHRVSAIRTREAVRTVELRLSLTCPRCAETQALSVGRSRCSKCGLRFSIEIEEDLCATCGYPLYLLESAVCPECGTPIVPGPAGVC